jgi:hypothetical protein
MKLSLVTAIYPGVTKYLLDFYKSILRQTDNDFDVWVGLDMISEKDVFNILGGYVNFHFVTAPANATPAVVRNYTLKYALKSCDAVALVDADDVLDKSRVASAKKRINNHDVVATGMNYIDSSGEIIDGFFDSTLGDPSFISYNAFGFSNTTWRSEVLAQFIPVPENCVLMDWYVTTLALYSGASLGYDKEPRMFYRQHPGNIAASRRPFRAGQIMKATDLVLGHYDLVLTAFAEKGIAGSEKFEQARERVKRFGQAIQRQAILEQYVTALNALPDRHVWWTCVAHPDLEGIWGG